MYIILEEDYADLKSGEKFPYREVDRFHFEIFVGGKWLPLALDKYKIIKMEKYLFICEDSTLYIFKGELRDEDINSSVDGMLQIIRISDLKQLDYDKVTWKDIQVIEKSED